MTAMPTWLPKYQMKGQILNKNLLLLSMTVMQGVSVYIVIKMFVIEVQCDPSILNTNNFSVAFMQKYSKLHSPCIAVSQLLLIMQQFSQMVSPQRWSHRDGLSCLHICLKRQLYFCLGKNCLPLVTWKNISFLYF